MLKLAICAVDVTVNDMEGILLPLMDNLTCPECKSILRGSVAHVKSQWVSVPVRFSVLPSHYPIPLQ